MTKAAARGAIARVSRTRKRISNLELILYPPSKHYTHRGFSDQRVRDAEKALGVRLPKSYIELLRFRNGARLRWGGVYPDEPPPRHHTDRAVYEFEAIAGIHPTAWNALPSFARTSSDEWQVPELLIPIDGDGHWYVCLDYRTRGPKGEPRIVHFEADRPNECTQIAPSFRELLHRLMFSDSNYIFAIVDRSLRDEALDTAMRSLGWNRRRCGHPNTWDSRRYGGVLNAAAYCAVHINDRDRRFPDQPVSRPLLCVDVAPKDQSACVRELAAFFGDRARLIHQPPDRTPIDLANLPTPRVRRVKPLSPIPFSPNDAHMALWDGRLDDVKRFVALGMKPDRRHSADTRTPLEIAAIRGHTAMVRFLLRHAERPVARAPLAAALDAGHLAIARAFIGAGAETSQADLRGAVERLHIEIVRLLLSQGIVPSPGLIKSARTAALEQLEPGNRAVANRIANLLEGAQGAPARADKPVRGGKNHPPGT
ncbi:MAG: SMI1/KNR4 family protein [Phycisphaeraceae bacterium]|nr:SMI1/KNR4 family protein [Phycisphaeraceae bacterium]